jgi:hypothetical protein
MPMHLRRIVDAVSYLIALGVTLVMRYGFDLNVYAAAGVGLLLAVALPFLISRFLALYFIRRMERAGQRGPQP